MNLLTGKIMDRNKSRVGVLVLAQTSDLEQVFNFDELQLPH